MHSCPSPYVVPSSTPAWSERSHVVRRRRSTAGCAATAVGRWRRARAIAAPAARPDAAAQMLVAEDNPVNQKVIVRMLEKRGYRVEVVTNGRAAVEATLRAQYILIFMDCQMPEMDGYAATAAIRARGRPQDRRTPIIALTANAQAGAGDLCLAAGMDAYLAKPLTLARLDATLSRWAGVDAAQVSASERTRSGRACSRSRQAGGAWRACRRDEPDFLGEVIAAYLQEMPPHLAALREAVLQADAPAIARAAHALKGSSRTIGAVALARLSADLEERSRQGTPSNGEQLVRNLEASFEHVRHHLGTLGMRLPEE